jgi:hypothetical protein
MLKSVVKYPKNKLAAEALQLSNPRISYKPDLNPGHHDEATARPSRYKREARNVAAAIMG